MKKNYAVILVLLALVSLAVAFIYFSKTAGSLPSYLPGYTQYSVHKHTKHGLAFFGLGLLLLLGAWMASGNKKPDQQPPTDNSVI
ncbi:MAG: hypothetical protein NVS1B7_0300 [Candidatus Saccharimonadales bacterium]